MSYRVLTRRLERLTFSSADCVVTNTPELAAALHAVYPGTPVWSVSNGVDRERLPAGREAFPPGIRLAYVGTLYGTRSLRPVLIAMKEFISQNPSAAEGLHLSFAGHADGPVGKTFRADVERLELSGSVSTLGILSAEQALELLAESSIAIVLAQNQTLMVPAKLYETVAMRIPTLVVTEPDSASAAEARRFGCYVVDSGDASEIARILSAAYGGTLVRPQARAGLTYPELAVEMNRILQGW